MRGGLALLPLLLLSSATASTVTGERRPFGRTLLGARFDPLLLNDRLGIQETIDEKGWLVGVEWKPAPDHGGGMGAFATEDVPGGTLIRRSPFEGGNFLQMQSYEDLAAFCGIGDPNYSEAQREALKEYVKDYLFRSQPAYGTDVPDDQRVYGVWLPGCGDNSANDDEEPNVEDRLIEPGLMGMYAKRDINKGEPLLSDYDIDYGVPPEWVARFAKDHLDGQCAFAGMNHKTWTD